MPIVFGRVYDSRSVMVDGIDGGRIDREVVELQLGPKRFERIRSAYYLRSVRDANEHGLSLEYSGSRVERITSTNGREVRDSINPPAKSVWSASRRANLGAWESR